VWETDARENQKISDALAAGIRWQIWNWDRGVDFLR